VAVDVVATCVHISFFAVAIHVVVFNDDDVVACVHIIFFAVAIHIVNVDVDDVVACVHFTFVADTAHGVIVNDIDVVACVHVSFFAVAIHVVDVNDNDVVACIQRCSCSLWCSTDYGSNDVLMRSRKIIRVRTRLARTPDQVLTGWLLFNWSRSRPRFLVTKIPG